MEPPLSCAVPGTELPMKGAIVAHARRPATHECPVGPQGARLVTGLVENESRGKQPAHQTASDCLRGTVNVRRQSLSVRRRRQVPDPGGRLSTHSTPPRNKRAVGAPAWRTGTSGNTWSSRCAPARSSRGPQHASSSALGWASGARRNSCRSHDPCTRRQPAARRRSPPSHTRDGKSRVRRAGRSRQFVRTERVGMRL